MKYLLDANVVSEPMKPTPNRVAVDWLRAHEPESVLNSVVLGEVQFGILQLTPGHRRSRLAKWFEFSLATFHVLEFDANVALTWAQLLVQLKKKGKPMPVTDSMVAATALHHELTVVTRNAVDFRHAGVKVYNPFLK